MKDAPANLRDQIGKYSPSSPAPRPAPLKVAVLCEDADTARMARRLHEHLAGQLADGCELDCSWWRVDTLRENAAFSASTRAARDASLLIVAAHADRALPAVVRVWLGRALAGPSQIPRALVALLDSAAPQPRHFSVEVSVETVLAEAAERAGADLFVHREIRPALPPENLAARAHTVTSTLAGILAESHHPPVCRGGDIHSAFN